MLRRAIDHLTEEGTHPCHQYKLQGLLRAVQAVDCDGVRIKAASTTPNIEPGDVHRRHTGSLLNRALGGFESTQSGDCWGNLKTMFDTAPPHTVRSAAVTVPAPEQRGLEGVLPHYIDGVVRAVAQVATPTFELETRWLEGLDLSQSATDDDMHSIVGGHTMHLVTRTYTIASVRFDAESADDLDAAWGDGLPDLGPDATHTAERTGPTTVVVTFRSANKYIYLWEVQNVAFTSKKTVLSTPCRPRSAWL